VLHTNTETFLGVVFLHFAFIVYLETRHSHPYIKQMPKYLWLFLLLVGIVLYRHVEVFGFLFASYLYVKKTKGRWGYFGPAFRGIQYFFLVAGIVGYHNPIIWISLFALLVRNFVGDLRDIEKDNREGIKTLPILIGMKHNIKYIHLATMLTTSYLWFALGSISLFWLPVIFLIQIITYRLTPR
jgi:1,4-dihydroxy-2-naphthoate octaprenyltransferase